MTKREAKKFVYRAASVLIYANIDGGSDWLEHDEDGNQLSDEDYKRVAEAVEELARELHRRGQK